MLVAISASGISARKPVSSVASLVGLLAESPFTPGSASTIFMTMWLGRVTPTGRLL